MDQALPGSTAFTSLGEWLAWLETLSPTEIELGLDRVLQVLDRLQPTRPGRVIHIAGTNGKGSSAMMLESLFLHTGERVGTYTSPHLDRYNERIRIDGRAVSDKEIVSAFEKVEAARQDLPLTYFEFGTLAAIVVFEKNKADTIILEVGMGGRLDAVNAIDPDAGIITNVSLDHCDWLGEDIESIASEKAGILRSNKPFIFGARNVPNCILESAEKKGVDLRRLGSDFDYTPESASKSTWSWSGRRTQLESLAMPSLPGRFQLQNAAAVLALVEAMQLDDLLDRDLINEAFAELELPGRCQLIETERSWLLDVAHNAEAAGVLSRYMADLPPADNTMAIIGMLRDKDRQGIVSPLCSQVDAWVAVTATGPRALSAGELASGIANSCNKPCLVADSLSDAMTFAIDRTTADDRILVTGSFYLVGPALNWLEAGLSGAHE
jgi:dihydrofolate synthase/folylpolyglutamate synthase